MDCYLFPEPSYFFFSSDIPGLLYYSHIPTMVIALLVGFFVFFHARHLLLNRLLLVISLSFSAYILMSLLAWTNVDGALILATWPAFGILQSFISIFCIYFIYVFLYKKDAPLKMKVVFLALLSPILLLAHTNLSVSGFDITYCDAFGYEGMLYKTYYTGLGVLAMVWIAGLLIRNYQKAEASFKKQIFLMGVGIELFLFNFFTTSFLATYLAGKGIFEDSSLEFYGMFGMTFFMIMISVLITRYRTFNVGMASSVTLTIGLVLLTSSQFTYVKSRTGFGITTITLVFTALIGWMLVRSVRKETKRKEEMQQLATRLERANKRLLSLDKQKSEFVSIASHQLRSPLTAIRGYASLLLEGSFGEIPQKAIEPLGRIAESSKLMAYSIEDYLNVSRIESGNMKYNRADFNLRAEVENVCDDLRSDAIKEGLVLLFRSDLNSNGVINADLGKTVQIVQNLINNAIKYTEKGSVKVLVRDDVIKKRIYVDVMDTGVGMDEDTQNLIFQKFERARNANTVNANGTGLGLFVALKMAQAMDGNITAESDGPGTGSCFTLEMPLAL